MNNYKNCRWLYPNYIDEKDMKRFREINVIDILEKIHKKYPSELKQHYKLFDEIEDKI